MVERENELSSKYPVNYLRGRVMPEDLLSILKIETPGPSNPDLGYPLRGKSCLIKISNYNLSNQVHILPFAAKETKS